MTLAILGFTGVLEEPPVPTNPPPPSLTLPPPTSACCHRRYRERDRSGDASYPEHHRGRDHGGLWVTVVGAVWCTRPTVT